MTCIEWRNEYEPYVPRRSSRGVLPKNALVGVAVTCTAFACAWVLCSLVPWVGGDRAEAMQEALVARSDPAASLFNSRFYLGPASASLSTSVAPQWYNRNSLAALPQPVPVPITPNGAEQGHELALHTPTSHSAELQSRRQGKPLREDSGQQTQAVASAPVEPSIFEKILASVRLPFSRSCTGPRPPGLRSPTRRLRPAWWTLDSP